jgi:hypothetical protein
VDSPGVPGGVVGCPKDFGASTPCRVYVWRVDGEWDQGCGVRGPGVPGFLVAGWMTAAAPRAMATELWYAVVYTATWTV